MVCFYHIKQLKISQPVKPVFSAKPVACKPVEYTRRFKDLPPIQGCNGLNNHFSLAESDAVRVEIGELLAKGIIKPSQHEAGEVISGIFLRPKQDVSY